MIRKYLDFLNEKLDAETYFSASNDLLNQYNHKNRSSELRTWGLDKKYKDYINKAKDEYTFDWLKDDENKNGNFILPKWVLNYLGYSDTHTNISLNAYLTEVRIAYPRVSENEFEIKLLFYFLTDYKSKTAGSRLLKDKDGRPSQKSVASIDGVEIKIEFDILAHTIDPQHEDDFTIDTDIEYIYTDISKFNNDIHPVDTRPSRLTNMNYRRLMNYLKSFLKEYVKIIDFKEELDSELSDKGIGPDFYHQLCTFISELNVNKMYKD